MMPKFLHHLVVLFVMSFTPTIWAQVSAVDANAANQAKPMRIIVPFAVGGASDTYTRLVAQKIGEQTGKTIVVENKTGAGGRISFDYVAHAAADGSTVALIDATYAMLPGLFANLPWDINSDLIPVVMITQTPFVIMVNEASGIKTLQELVARAKAQPGKLNYGSAGVGSVNHIVTERFRKEAGIDITHVPYKGMSEASVALMSNNVDLIIAASPTALSQIKGGKIRPLAVSTVTRSQAMPTVPTVVEGGLPSFIAINWFGFAMPKGTATETMKSLYDDVTKAVASPDVQAKLLAQGAEASVFTTDQFSEFVRAETKLWTDVTHSSGIKIDP